MNNRRIDLNLLTIFHAVVREGNVTRAGEKLGMSQPAVSAALARLRDTIGDPLFTRSNHGVQPTPRARQLVGPVDDALRLIRDALDEQSQFDPVTSRRNFNILMMDIGQLNLLPRLLHHLRGMGSPITLATDPILGEAQVAALESGTGDLAIGYWPSLTAQRGFRRQRLFMDKFICLLGADFPEAGEALSLEQYLAASHLVVATPDHRRAPVDRALADRTLSRHVVMRVPHFLAVPSILTHSDLVVTMPARPAKIFAANNGLRMAEPPCDLSAFPVSQYWHQRFDNDPAVGWLIDTMQTLFGDSDIEAPAGQ